MDSSESAYLLKMVQQIKTVRGEVSGVQDGPEVLVGVGEDHAMSFEVKDVGGLSIEGLDFSAQDKLPNGKHPMSAVFGGAY